ncbi:hypothetical protein FYK55_02725 [Roseiconus nitratireducens]|uniref:DUF4440 domain-containing protein n=1 Tax=Roseiconus nitratireducens TaxID=2605748 RepID=A0A5M6DEN6_9BACT|nr:hypothetical protein [Roseiconus nitratireducens]KAA5545853.1 hypothetical protein FYK55_02725 [Roseiconus nitratireducens]
MSFAFPQLIQTITMWNIIAEQPTLLAIMVGICAVALIVAWLQSGDRRFALGSIPFVLMIPLSYYVAGQIETDREQILRLIETTARAVEANDHQTAVSVIGDPETRQRALAELPKYEFTRVRAGNIQIRMVEGSFPPEATVDLDASVRLSQARGGMQNIPVTRRVILTFQKEPDEQWVVTDYTHMPLTGGGGR